MASLPKRRSISIRGVLYGRLSEFCQQNSTSASALVESLLIPILEAFESRALVPNIAEPEPTQEIPIEPPLIEEKKPAEVLEATPEVVPELKIVQDLAPILPRSEAPPKTPMLRAKSPPVLRLAAPPSASPAPIQMPSPKPPRAKTPMLKPRSGSMLSLCAPPLSEVKMPQAEGPLEGYVPPIQRW